MLRCAKSFGTQLVDKNMRQTWELLLAMTEREIKARYKFAVLGFLWIFLNPLLQMLVIGIIFSFVLKVPIPNYFAFLFTGLLVWNFFSMTLLKTTPSIVFELGLIEKAKFPREVIVLSIVLSNLFHTVMAFLLFVGVLAVIGQLIWWRVLFVIVALVWLTIFTSGLSLLTAALNVRYRDVNFIVQAIMPIWFYATPILYSLALVPERLRFFMNLNPLASVVEIFHWALVGGQFPTFSMIASNAVTSFVVVVCGWCIFRREAPFFDDWI